MISRLTVSMRQGGLMLSLVIGTLASFVSAASAEEVKYRDGRFLETLGGVTIQRADEASSDEAVRNMPFLPGDRVWTDEAGRAEIVFAQGEILWIAERSKVDSLGRGGREQDERLGLRVFAGSFGARVRSGGPGFEFRAPGGTITTTGASAFRVDVRLGETVVSVSEGEVLADLGGERTTVRGGERLSYGDGRVDGPFRYQRARADAFDRWCDERAEELTRMARTHDRLPDELDTYGDELDRNGDWVYDEPQGYVYVPRVASNWAPYTYGRWVYTLYGWTWVADEPWGFVTSHYGRWGYSSRVGWHWLPRVGFSGAWVGWSSPGGIWNQTIGWCALGFNDRPFGSLGYGTGGRLSARGSRSVSPGHGWSFANRADIGRANSHRRRVNVPAEDVARAGIWNQGSAPDREFREARRGRETAQGERGRNGSGLGEAVGVVTRGEGRGSGLGDDAARIYVKPSPGDSTPELRSDPTTTIPTPESRRRRGIGQDGFKDEQDDRKSRSRREDPSLSLQENESGNRNGTGSSIGPASAPRQRLERATPDGRPSSEDQAAQSDRDREREARDPLLSRFFRSITRPDAAARESRPTTSTPTTSSDDSLSRGRDTQTGGQSIGDDSAAREQNRRERSRPNSYRPSEPPSAENGGREPRTPEPRAPEGRGLGENRERARPSGIERPQPRNPPPPQSAPQEGSSDERGTRRRPRPEA